MKKLFIAAIIGLGLLTAQAQGSKTISFLNVASIQVTNTLNFTNLFSPVSSGSNSVGAIYTNRSNVRVIATNADFQNVFVDVPLWAPKTGGWWGQTSTNYTDSTLSGAPVSIVVRSVAGSGTMGANTIAVAPVFGDIGTVPGKPSEVTATTIREVYSFTPTASTIQVWSFPVSLYKWPGATALRVIYVNNAATAASSQVVITDLALSGYQP